MVEGTMSSLLTEMFDKLREKKITIDQLPKAFEKLIYKYHLEKIGNKEQELKRLCESDKETICDITYMELNQYLKLFSGNLDARKMKEISKNFGINIPEESNAGKLLMVKNRRNSLAHGETTFTNAAQDITVKELKEMIDSVYSYMSRIVNEYEKFVNNKIKYTNDGKMHIVSSYFVCYDSTR